MKLKNLTLACAMAAASAGPIAANAFTAQDIYLNVLSNVDGAFFGGDADTRTNIFTELAVNPNAQSVYNEGIVPGALNVADGILNHGELLTFFDKGEAEVTGAVPSLSGPNEGLIGAWSLRVKYSVSGVAQVNLDADGVGGSGPLPGLNVNNPGLLASNTNGVTWAAQYAVFGVTEGTPIGLLPQFMSGVVEVFLVDNFGAIPDVDGGINGQKLLELDLTTPVDGVQFGNLVLSGVLDYSWYTPGTNALVESMFTFLSGDQTFYSAASDTTVDWRFDTSVDPNLVPFNNAGTGNIKPGLPGGAAAIAAFTGACVNPDLPGTPLCRVTNLNSTVAFQVPEPAGLALIGAALLSMGVAGRRKAKRQNG